MYIFKILHRIQIGPSIVIRNGKNLSVSYDYGPSYKVVLVLPKYIYLFDFC